MGCCNGSVLLLIVCSIQLVSIMERLVLDFMGFLYLSLIPSFIQIIIIIIAIFGLCLYRHRFIIVYLVWGFIFIAWNIFVICLYSGVGSFDENSYNILSFGHGTSWWIAKRECNETNTCKLAGSYIEIIHAGIQVFISVIGCASAAFVIYLLREKDDTSPIFQIYKAPPSRRSSVSSRVDRETSLTRTEHWEAPINGRDSIRSNRSTRSERTSRASAINQSNQNSNRQSKRSNRGSTRSKSSKSGRTSSQQNGTAKKNRPDSLPWAPTIAPSSGIDSDIPQTPTARVPQIDRGHENESYGYGSSSENPYSDYNRQRASHGISPGPPPGPPPAANRIYRPTNLAHSFNSVADLPPPLDEGPEAYSRDSVAFPAPPPPLADGPEPYRSAAKPIGRTNVPYQHSHNNSNGAPRPLHLNLPPATPTKSAMSSPSAPSSPGSSSLSSEKSGAISGYNYSRTLENNLERSPVLNKDYQYPMVPPSKSNNGSNYHQQISSTAGNPSKRGRSTPSNGVTPKHLITHRRDVSPNTLLSGSERGDALSNPLYANHKFGQNNAGAAKASTPALALPAKLPYKHSSISPSDQEQISPNGSSERLSSINGGQSRYTHDSPRSPTAELRQMRSANSNPKDNTFKRMVSGNLSQRSVGATRLDNNRSGNMSDHDPNLASRHQPPNLHSPQRPYQQNSQPYQQNSQPYQQNSQPYQQNPHQQSEMQQPATKSNLYEYQRTPRQPENIARQPTQHMRQPDHMTRQPAQHIHQPDNSSRQPSQHVRQPDNSSRQPAQHVRQPDNSSRQPAQHVRQLDNIPRQPPQHVHQPPQMYNSNETVNNRQQSSRLPTASYSTSRPTDGTSRYPPNNQPPISNVRNQTMNDNKQLLNSRADNHITPPKNTPPWEKQTFSEPVKPASRQSNNEAPLMNHRPSPRAAVESLTGTLKEVTSSYGGLYSSRQSPAPSRRRVNQRGDPSQSNPNYAHYPLTNITDDVKTTKTPFVSSRPSVI